VPRGPFDQEILGLMLGPPLVWPCAAGTQKANLLGIIPPSLNESTLTLRVGAAALVAAKATAVVAAAHSPIAANFTAFTLSSFERALSP
jgi:hypothetical protein